MSRKKNQGAGGASPAKIVFGPVPSRRLGRSLGVDLVPAKTCSLDCVYCEAGRTTRLTTERTELVPMTVVLAELEAVLASRPELDYITFSGAGEPTLHSGIGRIIGWLKERYPAYRLCLLTNGILFTDPGVRRELAPLDLVVPSLDAADEATFRRINRPAPGLACLDLPAAYAAFRRKSAAALWLEIFVLPGVNDHPASVAALRDAVALIRPDKVQLNTLDRPGTESWVTAATAAILRDFATALSDCAPVEIIGKYQSCAEVTPGPAGAVAAQVVALLRRRPCTLSDLAASLGLPEAEVQAVMAGLMTSGKVASQLLPRGEFFVLR